MRTIHSGNALAGAHTGDLGPVLCLFAVDFICIQFPLCYVQCFEIYFV